MLDPNLAVPRRTFAHRIKICLEAYRKQQLDRQLLLAEDRGTWHGWRDVLIERAKSSDEIAP
jgi:hypothetical protein